MKITFKKDVTIEPNDVVQFVVMNTGKIDHEFSIGSAVEQLKHREMMRQMGNHEHDSGSTVTVNPAKPKSCCGISKVITRWNLLVTSPATLKREW